ncbi:MAG: Putative Blue (Type 1) copper protein, cupredoxin family (modular protein) [Nitrospira sp.]
MRLRIFTSLVVCALVGAGPTTATAPYTSIIIDSGSPYFVPKSATVSSGASIRWDNPTPTEHTITHIGCMEDGASCAFDSGLVLPNDSFTISGLAPGKYPYICRVHPIMYGILTVTDSQQPSQL